MVRSHAKHMLLLLMMSAAAMSCSDGLGPASELTVYLSLEEGLIALGDTVELVAVAHNGSDEEISAGVGCGPGITVFVTDADGTPTDLSSGGFWTCQERDSNVLLPGETDAVTWPWLPTDTGSYSLQAGVAVRENVVIASQRVEVRVVVP